MKGNQPTNLCFLGHMLLCKWSHCFLQMASLVRAQQHPCHDHSWRGVLMPFVIYCLSSPSLPTWGFENVHYKMSYESNGKLNPVSVGMGHTHKWKIRLHSLWEGWMEWLPESSSITTALPVVILILWACELSMVELQYPVDAMLQTADTKVFVSCSKLLILTKCSDPPSIVKSLTV